MTKRPRDVVGNAVHVMRIATGEITESPPRKDTAGQEMGRKGGAMRAAAPPPERRSEIARKAAEARWNSTVKKMLDTPPKPRKK